MKACEFIPRYLSKVAGVGHVFTYAGGTNAMLLDAIRRNDLMTIVPMRHEENAALAADGYARLRHGLGLALAMSGPGATNLITGMAQSYFDSVPVLHLTGNVTTGTFKYGRPLRQLGYQETDIVPIATPVTKAAYFVDRAEMVPYLLRDAIRQALEGRPGPTLYDIPFDVQKQEIDPGELTVAYGHEERRTLSEADYDRFRTMLAASRRPVLLLGGGIQTADAAAAATAFARRLRLPVVVSLLGKDAFPNDDPLYVGFIGAYGNRHANRTLAKADLVIALGTRLDSRQTAKISAFAANKQIIHVEVDPCVIGSTVPTALGIHLDLRSFFRDFAEWEARKPLEFSTPQAWLDQIGEVRTLLRGDGEEDQGDLNPKALLRRLSRAQPSGSIYTVDVGGHQMWTAQVMEIKAGDRILYSGGLGTMGYAIPAAIGAHFAAPDRPVLAITGDGGFQMAVSELSTIATLRAPVKLVVINNGMLGLMRYFQDENFAGLHPATVEGYSVPDVVRVADAFGLPARALTHDRDVSAALDWLQAETGPAVLEVKTPVEWAPYPKVVVGGDLTQQRPELPPEMAARLAEIMP